MPRERKNGSAVFTAGEACRLPSPAQLWFPLRCILARSTWLIALTLALGAWIISPKPLSAQISPGPLSKAHQSLSGSTQCVACHKAGTGHATFQCLECHSEIASRLNAGRGLHFSFLGKTDSSQGCVKCHSEHNGENFAMIHWTPTLKDFDHTKTGFPLLGKHAAVQCRSCHEPMHIPAAERRSLEKTDPSRTFLGLTPACINCHRDQHEGRRGQNCLQCHNMNDWKSVLPMTQWTKLVPFNHSQTHFPLTGAHLQVSCAQCHKPMEDGQPKFVGIAFRSCNDCHADPHHGSFTSPCQSCHNTRSWNSFSMSALASQFDHSTTKFPLLGRHANVNCLKCHAGGNFKKPIAFQTCANCHHPDPHGGQFSKRPDGGRCESCHTVEGFKPSTFGITEHAATQYPLLGMHAKVECALCHLPAGRATLFKIKFANCKDCHREAHEGQFAAAPMLNRCESCHTVQGFHPSTFTMLRHQETAFPLTGAHVATACSDCHKPFAAGMGTGKSGSGIPYHFGDRSCTACHQDPHHGQFKQLMGKLGHAGTASGCETCHTTSSWLELPNFDHASTGFPLSGSHRAVGCVECHKPLSAAGKSADVDFSLAPKDCQSCHQDPHAGQFAKDKVTACAECHNSTKWTPSIFNHGSTRFPLQGEHRNVSCARCHSLMKTIGAKRVLFYQPTPIECTACHGPEILKK